MPISQEVKATDFDSVIHGFDSHMGCEGGCMVYIDGKPFGAIENIELPRIEVSTSSMLHIPGNVSNIPGDWNMECEFTVLTNNARKRRGLPMNRGKIASTPYRIHKMIIGRFLG